MVFAEHLYGSMPHQLKLVLIRAGYALNESGEGMPAGMRRQSVPAVLRQRIIYAAAVEKRVKLLTVVFKAQIGKYSTGRAGAYG